MFDSELYWLENGAVDKSPEYTFDLTKSEALTELITSSLNMSLLLADITSLVLNGMPEETLRKLRDCYGDMFAEVRQCLRDLHGNMLTKAFELPHSISDDHDSSMNCCINSSRYHTFSAN